MGTHLSLAPKTPDKMRVLLALTLLVAGGKEKREMEMWMKMKAMEGCFGEDLVKDHMIKMKRSAAKCMRVKTKMYMKCMMKKKVKTCMRKDIKDKLEEHFGGVDKLVKET